MRPFLVLFVAVLITAFAYPALGQSTPERPQRSDGGLHVSNGGVFGYVGGSGSPSGRIVGPGRGGGGGGSAPAQEAKDVSPNSLTGGSVGPAIDASGASDETTEAASNSTTVPWLPLAVGTGLGLILLILMTRRLRPASH
jgi:hypothetical protein